MRGIIGKKRPPLQAGAVGRRNGARRTPQSGRRRLRRGGTVHAPQRPQCGAVVSSLSGRGAVGMAVKGLCVLPERQRHDGHRNAFHGSAGNWRPLPATARARRQTLRGSPGCRAYLGVGAACRRSCSRHGPIACEGSTSDEGIWGGACERTLRGYSEEFRITLASCPLCRTLNSASGIFTAAYGSGRYRARTCDLQRVMRRIRSIKSRENA